MPFDKIFWLSVSAIMLLLSHPTGNTFSRALLAELVAVGQLGVFATTLNVRQDSFWLKWLPPTLREELLRRSFELRINQLASRPSREIVRLGSKRLGLGYLSRHEAGWASVDSVYRDMDRWTSRKLSGWAKDRAITSVYCYEDAALETFRAAKKIGLTCNYDLPIAYWETSQNILHEEALRLPEWRATLGGTSDSRQKLDRKEDEFAAADVVICPSSFVLSSLPPGALSAKRCVVAEFGTPDVKDCDASARPKTHQRLRVLFAGSMTQRKGLADVFEAMRLLNRKDVELVVMGSLVADYDFYRKRAEFTYEPTRPHHHVLNLMRTCDVLVLPSLVEGRALVQQEAMACGLPIIVTVNAGGADLVVEGNTGFLVPIRDPQAIAQKLNWLAENRHATREMGRCARDHAGKLKWSSYCKKIIDAIGVPSLTEKINA